MRNKSRLLAGLVIIILTVLAFAYYLDHHSNLLKQLKQISPWLVAWLLLLYVGWFAAVTLTVQATLRLCRKALPMKDSLLLNAYSTLVNFFVPGQGGVVVRGVYLKKRDKLPYKVYFFATMLSYAVYALLSAVSLVSFSRPWWQTLIVLLAVVSLSILVLRFYERRKGLKNSVLDWQPANILLLLLANFLQILAQVVIYSLELHSVNPHISLIQSITYTGAANFALFVALTPGAIGIRESFLFLSQKLHHISSVNIVAASVIDRSAFILFLAILFMATVAFHTKDKLKIRAVTET